MGEAPVLIVVGEIPATWGWGRMVGLRGRLGEKALTVAEFYIS
jgi:hypothetical protein